MNFQVEIFLKSRVYCTSSKLCYWLQTFLSQDHLVYFPRSHPLTDNSMTIDVCLGSAIFGSSTKLSTNCTAAKIAKLCCHSLYSQKNEISILRWNVKWKPNGLDFILLIFFTCEEKFIKIFCCYNCLDFLHIQSFSQCSLLVFPVLSSKSSVSKRSQILNHLPQITQSFLNTVFLLSRTGKTSNSVGKTFLRLF